VALGDASALGETTEQGELTYGSIGDSKEVYALRTFGKIYRFGRRLFLADDLGALTTLPEKIGRAAAEIESNLFWLQIIEANPNMGDGLPLFCAQHNNVITGVQPINVANMALVEEMLAEQVSDQGVVLNLQLDAVAVHTSNRLALQQLFGPIVATQEGNVNPYAGGAGLGYCYEPRLKLKSNWYAFASTGQIDLVERAYLNGQAGLYTETRMGFEVDGIEIKCRLDVAMKALEWRGMIKVGI
jgi:hypothetical protein